MWLREFLFFFWQTMTPRKKINSTRAHDYLCESWRLFFRQCYCWCPFLHAAYPQIYQKKKTFFNPKSAARVHVLQSQAVPIISSACLLDLDPVPTFSLSVDLSTKSLNVTVEPGKAVYARWCYRSNADCMGEDGSPQVTVRTSRTLIHCHTLWIFLLMSYVSLWSAQIDPSWSPSALVNITYLLPCVCVQVLSVHFFLFFFKMQTFYEYYFDDSFLMPPPVFPVLPGILQVQRFRSENKMPFRRSNPRWWVLNVTTSLFLTGIHGTYMQMGPIQ